MKKAVKWILIIGGGLVLVVIIALIIVPMFVNIARYKPQIEKKVSEITGRSVSIEGELQLSLFPWAGLAFSDLHVGNPPGFKEKDFLSVKNFEVRVKLLPLLSKDIQVKRFILQGPRIVLEKSRAGRGNWERMETPSVESPAKPLGKGKTPAHNTSDQGLPIQSLAVGELAITNGSILWVDASKGERRKISDVTLRLHDVSLDRSIRVALSGNVMGHPLSLKGEVGPVGKDPGKGTILLDLVLDVLEQMEVKFEGKIVDPATRPRFDLSFEVAPFSPRKLMAALDQTLPVTPADPKVLNRVAVSAKLKGNTQSISISNGVLDLDESKLKFSARGGTFSKPDVNFDLNLDQIDLDRYLPLPSKNKSVKKNPKSGNPKGAQNKTDYTPFRRLVMDGTIRAAHIKAHGAKIQDLYLKVSGKNGRFRFDPLALKLYQGDVSAKGALDVRQNMPKSTMELKAKEIQIHPLLQDLLNKEYVEGNVKVNAVFRMKGDDLETIKRTLNGTGDLLFRDGAIVGIDLTKMVRNIKTGFGLVEKRTERPRTDFSKFHAPFTIINGVVKTSDTTLISPALRVSATGKADLAEETLNFRIEPEFVATLKGQKDTKERSGIMVPVLVNGSFEAPKFRPDLEGMLEKSLQEKILERYESKEMPLGKDSEKDELKILEEKAKDLLKELGLGQ